MNTLTHSNPLPFIERLQWTAAWFIADALTRAVSLIRPIQQHTEAVDDDDDGEGPPSVPEPCVYVLPLKGRPWYQVDAWIERDGKESNIALRVLGCHIEVFYLPKRSVPQP